MLMIRFQRIGRTNDPAFRIAVLEKERAAQAGNIVEQLGTYNPRSKAVTLNKERVLHWISMGAQPTDSIHNLLIRQGVIEGKKINALPKKTVQVDEAAVVAAAAAAEAEKKAKADAAAAAKAAEEAAAQQEQEAVAGAVEMPTEAEVVAEAEPATEDMPTEAPVVEETVTEATPAVDETPAA